MTQHESGSTADDPNALRHERQDDLIWYATWLALVMSVVGVVDGVWMTLKRNEVTCQDGTYFPEGTTDFTCYAHPQLGVGIAVIAISVILGVVVVCASIAARAAVRALAEQD